MFHYTPNKMLLKTVKKTKKLGYNKESRCSYYYDLASKMFPTYWERTTFMQYWENVSYYSPVELSHVPVNGTLFPVKYFDKTIDK